MSKELKIEDTEKLYEEFEVFLKEKKFEEEYNKLLESRPFLSIDKHCEYHSLVRDTLIEFLTENGYTTLDPLIMTFIMEFDRLYFGRMQETFIHCYR